MKKMLMGLLVAGVLFLINQSVWAGENFGQFAQMTLRPVQGKRLVEPKLYQGLDDLSRSEVFKRPIQLFERVPAEVGNWERIRASIDLSDPVDSNVPLLKIETVYSGYGNFRRAVDTVDVFSKQLSKHSRTNLTLEFASPSYRTADAWAGLTWKLRF